jgi:hypothetical protein
VPSRSPRTGRGLRSAILRVATAACLFALAGGCGSSSSSGGNPATAELSYFASDAPFVAVVQTDPNAAPVRNAIGLFDRLPFASAAQSAIVTRLRAIGLDYDADVRPLFGNPVSIGIPRPHSHLLVVWVTAKQDGIKALISRLSAGGVRQMGLRDGATLYAEAGVSLAVSGGTIILGTSQAEVADALDRHAHGGGITPAQYDQAASGLGEEAFVTAIGDPRDVLRNSRGGLFGAPFRTLARTPWVSAIRDYGLDIDVSDSELKLRFHIRHAGYWSGCRPGRVGRWWQVAAMDVERTALAADTGGWSGTRHPVPQLRLFSRL